MSQSAGVVQVEVGQHQQVQLPDPLPAQVVRRSDPPSVRSGAPDASVPAVHQHGEGCLRLPQQDRVAIAHIDKVNQQHPHHRLSARGACEYPNEAAHPLSGRR